jgi:hypothetical protein
VPSGIILAAFYTISEYSIKARVATDLEVAGDETPPQSLGVPLAALRLDSKAVQELFELLPNADCSREGFVVDPVVSAPLLVANSIAHERIVDVEEGQVILKSQFCGLGVNHSLPLLRP